MKTQYVACSLCGRDDWIVRYPATLSQNSDVNLAAFRCTSSSYGRHPQIVQCCYCGYVYANPRWVSDELLDAYAAVEDERYVREREGRVITFRRHLNALQRFTGPPQGRKLLDVGAYIGVFVEVAEEAGWDAYGVEPSQWAVSVARQRGLSVCQGTQETLDVEEGAFDVVTMWDVIEHMDDPPRELAQAYRLLKPGGILAVHTMNVDSVFARLMGRRWPWLMDMHIHYFSARTLKQMLQKEGFEVLASGAQGRTLRIGYLASRLEGIVPSLGRWAQSVIERLGLDGVAIPVNFGDLITVYARRSRTE